MVQRLAVCVLAILQHLQVDVVHSVTSAQPLVYASQGATLGTTGYGERLAQTRLGKIRRAHDIVSTQAQVRG